MHAGHSHKMEKAIRLLYPESQTEPIRGKLLAGQQRKTFDGRKSIIFRFKLIRAYLVHPELDHIFIFLLLFHIFYCVIGLLYVLCPLFPCMEATLHHK